MRLDQILLKLGLNQKEAKMYLIILETGEILLSELAKKSNIPRTSCYEIIKELVQKGLITFMVKRKKKYYFAENPEHLIKEIEEKYLLAKESMFRLRALYNVSGIKPKIRFYEGTKGIQKILQEIINEKRNFLAITSIEDAEEILRGGFTDFIENRINHNLKVQLITDYSPASVALKKLDAKELRETRFISDKYNFKTANFMFGNKTAIISLKKNLLGIVIEDEDVSDTFKMYFEIIWQNTKATATEV